MGTHGAGLRAVGTANDGFGYQIKSAFLNQPIEIEVAALRGQFPSAIGMGNALPQLLIRCSNDDKIGCRVFHQSVISSKTNVTQILAIY